MNMNTMQQAHFAAFKAKCLGVGGPVYEKREEPDNAVAMTQLAKALESIADGFEQFKSSVDSRIDRVETRVARPGAFTGTRDIQPASGEPILIDAETGKRLLTLKAGDNVREKFREAGRTDVIDHNDGGLTLCDWLRAVAGQKSTPLAQKAMSVGTDASGGYMVPTVLLPGVLEALVAQSSLMQAGARMVSVEIDAGGGAKSYVMAAVDTVPTAAWRAEAGPVTESDPAFRTVTATPRSLAFLFKVSRELLADAFNLDSVLAVVIAQAMAKEMDRAGLLGSGTAPEPRGIGNVSGIQTVGNGAAGTALATIKYANLMSAIQAILQANGPMPNAAIMAPRTLVGFGNLVDSTGQPLQRPDLLRDMRMIATSQIPINQTVGASTDCSSMFVGNFARTRFVLREAVSIQKLNELFAGNGQVGFMCHVRADFVVEYPTTMALVTGIRP